MELLNIWRPNYCGRNKTLSIQEHPNTTALTLKKKKSQSGYSLATSELFFFLHTSFTFEITANESDFI